MKSLEKQGGKNSGGMTGWPLHQHSFVERISLSLLYLVFSFGGRSQGLVNFFNYSGETVTAGSVGQQTLIAGPTGSFYFGLLIAAPGTTEPSQFSFSGAYATNVNGTPGRLYGGSDVAVPGWGYGSQMSYEVAGWSANLGHDWNPQWQAGSFVTSGYFGVSQIATIWAGVPWPQIPVPYLFSGFGNPDGINAGWNLAPVGPIPEPSPFSIGGLGMLLIAILRRRTSQRRPSPALVRLTVRLHTVCD